MISVFITLKYIRSVEICTGFARSNLEALNLVPVLQPTVQSDCIQELHSSLLEEFQPFHKALSVLAVHGMGSVVTWQLTVSEYLANKLVK